MATATRDYGLTGADTRAAIEHGLADAQWFRPAVAPERLRELMVRTNGRAARDTVAWLVLLVGLGALAFWAWGSWWAVPAFAAYGALYGGAADSRWHECGHGTAFRTPWLNDVVYYLASFMLLREPTMWRWSHFRHHTDTLVVGRDPEIITPRPTSLITLGLNFFNLVNGPKALWRMVRHAAGSVDDDARDFVPESELGKVVWEARAFLAVLAGIVGWSIAASTPLPLLYVGLPSFYGMWLLLFFALTQHAGLREDVLDHRLNTRTVYMNPVFRFLYSNMNYHVEHHMFPSVPYHALPALHEEVKDALAVPYPSTLAAYREIVSALVAQHRDPTYDVPPPALPDLDPAEQAARVVVMAADGRVDLCAADDLEPGQVVGVELDDRRLAVYRLGPDEYAVTEATCTHGRANLADGLVIDCSIIECPKHNGRFDIRTGEPLRRPVEVPLPVYPAEVIGERVVTHIAYDERPAS